jgi:hypothetical protein
VILIDALNMQESNKKQKSHMSPIHRILYPFLFQETFMFNLRWKNILVLMSVWSLFLVLQVLKVYLLH